MYKLMPTEDETVLFSHFDGNTAERYGAVGYVRVDFGTDGERFWSTWFDSQPHLFSEKLKKELENIIDSLRFDGQTPPFESRKNLSAFCAQSPGKKLTKGGGYKVETADYSYYFRCMPGLGDYDIYIFAFDNRYLLPRLARKPMKGGLTDGREIPAH